MEIKEYKDPRFEVFMKNMMSLGHKINSVIKEQNLGAIPGKIIDFNKVSQGHHVVKNKRNGQSVGVKYNSLIPNAELFSLAMEIVQPAIEEFEASNIFTTDTGFAPGAEVVGFDNLTRTGEARLSGRGTENGDIPRADISLGRNTQVIGKLDTYVKVTIDDIQRVAARNNAGLAPMLDLMAEKLNTARWVIGRQRELMIWQGGIIESKNMGIASLLSYFSSTAADYNATTPAFGREAVVATKESVVTWEAKLGLASGKGGMYIMEDLSDHVNYVQRLGTYKVSHIILTRYWMNKLSTIPFSLYDSRPIIQVVREALSGVEFVGTTALEGSTARAAYGNPDMTNRADVTASVTGQKSGFIAIDARKQNFVIADPEPINFLPAFVDADGSVKQVARMQSAGILAKHKSAMSMGIGIDA